MSWMKFYDFILGKRELVDDREWMEVMYANGYALFMGYLSMAVKGLGFLVLTWTTVVLLGGFVSDLGKKDFWCLVFITLVQTAGIFDVFLNEKLGYLGFSFLGYTMVVFNNGFLLGTLAAVQIVAFVVVLCPFVAVYMFGLLISSGIAVCRLIQHDYGSKAPEKRNLKPALDVLYSLALLQGAIFCFKLVFGLAKGFIVNKVATSRNSPDLCSGEVWDYLRTTLIICEKDPSSARGRNLITYAVDLMGSKSPDDYLSGLRVLDGFTSPLSGIMEEEWQVGNHIQDDSYYFMKQEYVLMKHLIMPGYSSDILQKLLQTLCYRSIYDREAKQRASRVVDSIAADIRLEEFPGGIRCISSLIDTLEEYRLLQPFQRDWLKESYEQDWMEVAFANKFGSSRLEVYKKQDIVTDPQNTYKDLMVQGFRILGKLATNVDNCRVIADTPCLLSKIMAPVTYDLLHHIDHAAWSSIVEGSLKVMAQITAATGQTGTKLRSEISNSKEAIRTMMRILECHSDECKKLQKHVIWILGHLYRDTSLSLMISREKFTEMLVNIMTDDKEATQARQVAEPKEATQAAREKTELNKYMEKRRVEEANMGKEARRATAANTLVALSSKFEITATVIMKANDNAVDLLTTMIFQKHKCRLTAAQILEYLCIHYTNDDESLRKLQKAMIHAVPKVLGEILSGDPQVIGLSNVTSNYQRDYTVGGYATIEMLSLCVTVCNTFISEDQDMALQFNAIAPRDASFSFPKKLKEIVDKNKKRSPYRLRILKLTCKMVITMMKHRGTYVKEDLESLMDALSSASKEMFILDGSMVFDFRRDETTPKPSRSLASLVKEARELVDRHDRLLSYDLSLWSPV